MAYREVARVEIQENVRRKPQVVFQDEERHAFLPWNGESTMRSPTGATPRSTRTTTSSTSSLSIRCLSPSALLARRWRSGWTASWCTSTVGAACSRPTSASPGADGPPNPPSSRPTPPGLPTASKPATGSWTPPWPISPTGSWKAPCPGPSSGRATSSSAWANATSMVIHDLHVVRSVIFPTEAYSPLAVDPNAVLARSVPGESLQPVAGQSSQVSQGGSVVQYRER